GRFESAFRATLENDGSGELPEEVRQGIAELGFGDGSGLIQQELARAARASTPDVTAVTIDDGTSVDTLKEQARTGEWVGVVSLPASELATDGPADPSGGPIELFVPSELSPRNAQDLRELLRKSVVRARFAGRDDEFERVTNLLDRPPLEIVRLGETGGESEESRLRMIVPFAFMMLLWVATLTAGNYLLTSTIEEKSNKVIEVVLSAVGPLELLWGKILGLAMVSLVIVVTYGGLALAGMVAMAMGDLISPALLAWSALFFVIAYFTVAALMSAVGSAVSDLREAQSLMAPIMIMLIVPMMLSMPITENPNGTLAVGASLLPPILPFVMVMRLGAATEPVPIWQLVAAGTIGIASVLAFVWAAARIFRVGILMQGKAPSPFELWRWIRQS
ncbi:MAG: ABC transporter permease, partial [Planctomycetota bacterium]|nr:ABC transporter permease [Planctomycetota bacterium]